MTIDEDEGGCRRGGGGVDGGMRLKVDGFVMDVCG